jgi:hypothetical protein
MAAANNSDFIRSNVLHAIHPRYVVSPNDPDNVREIEGFDIESSIEKHFESVFDDDWEIDVKEDFDAETYAYEPEYNTMTFQYILTVTSPEGEEYEYTIALDEKGMYIDAMNNPDDLPDLSMVLENIRTVLKKVAGDVAEYQRQSNASGGRRRRNRKTRKGGKKSRKTHKRGRKHAKKTHKRRH